MGFFRNNKGSIISDVFMLKEDVAEFMSGQAVDVSLYDTYLTLTDVKKKQPVTLQYSQITDVFHGLKTEIQGKEKSAIGRGLAGGLLFGGAGAVVGAMTAKETKTKKLMFIISYTAANGEEKFLVFEDTRKYKGKKLSQKLRELCNIKEKEAITSL